MPELSVNVVIAAAVVLGLGLVLLTVRLRGFSQRQHADADVPPDSREGRLSRRLAGMVGCTPAQALPAIRREIKIAPDQTDETLLKRAAYHYRQELPESSCPVYRDRAAG